MNANAPLELHRNYVDYLEELVQDSIRESNHKLIASLSFQRLQEIRERHHQDWRKFELAIANEENLGNLLQAPTPYNRKEAIPGEFRPVIHGRISRSSDVFGGDGSHAWEEGQNLDRLREVKRFLLYAHRIVLADPLWYINQWLGGQAEDEYVAKSRTGLANFLDFIYQVKDLVRSNIILFYPQYEHTGVGFPDDCFEDSGFMDWYQKRALQPEDTLIATYASPLIIELMFYCVRYGGSCFIDNPRLVPTFREILDYGRALGGSYLLTKPDRVSIGDDSAFRVLGQTSLPLVDTLTFKDIVAVRANSEGFGRFRDLLRDGLLRIDSGDSTDSSVLRQAVEASLAEGRVACEKDIRGSSLLAQAGKYAGNFTVGAIAGVLAGGPITGIATGAATACLSILREYIFSLKEQGARKALMRHYALWEVQR